MIPTNIIHRIFRIKCGDSVGTAFTIDVDKKQYLVTARHVVNDFGFKVPIEIFGNGLWTAIDASLVGHGVNGVDVTVVAPSVAISPPDLPIVPSSAGLTYGQDVYFLGFPYGVLSQVIFGSDGYPLPLVKKAILSAFAEEIYLLDGHNNPGFSGGPVLFSNTGGLPLNIAAIVSGYRFQPEAIHFGADETPLTYRHNTGIMITYKIETALNIIKANPIGASV